jgi:SAM-dependent methyltransferase
MRTKEALWHGSSQTPQEEAQNDGTRQSPFSTSVAESFPDAVGSPREDQARIAQIIDALPGPLEILEAGCGRQWQLKLSVPYRLTGIDTDADALKARLEDKRDLDEAILGDLRTAKLAAGRFDVIYCSWVLEHVDGAERVLENFSEWLKPRGLLVVRVPDRDSLFGIATRCTPFWFHVGYYRWILGVKTAGTPGHGPYPTCYDAVISRAGFDRFCSKSGFSLIETHRVDTFLRRSAARRVAGNVIGALSFGTVPWRWNNLTFIAQKVA